MRIEAVKREVQSSGTMQVARATIKATPKIFDNGLQNASCYSPKASNTACPSLIRSSPSTSQTPPNGGQIPPFLAAPVPDIKHRSPRAATAQDRNEFRAEQAASGGRLGHILHIRAGKVLQLAVSPACFFRLHERAVHRSGRSTMALGRLTTN